ncbi:MAG: SGNH/GDSL hydrolase family protein [Acidobacteriota bacterium]|nr:SGNH/GDSL hydrolase family protein [Acidobacteriota bacterium]MDH3524580.1 SGNH/GDSL hydrolase family protein [Acidobacteriota bacterium]
MRRAALVLAVNLALLAVLLGAVELASRLLAPTGRPQPLMAATLEDWVTTREFHPLLFWRMSPRRAADGTAVVNELGLRGPLPGKKRAGELRILSLGESTTAAFRLPLERAYTGVAARELEAATGRPVTAINAGVGGYALAQGVTFAKLYGLDLEPDVVLTYFGFNDFLRVGFRAERDAMLDPATAGLTDRELLSARSKPLARALLWLEGRSNFARWAMGRQPPNELRRGTKVRVPETDRLFFYEELRELCRARRIRLVVLVPIYRSFHRHERFLRALGDSGFEVLDLPTLLAPGLPDRRPYFFDPVHPRAELHRLIGEAVAKGVAASLPAG